MTIAIGLSAGRQLACAAAVAATVLALPAFAPSAKGADAPVIAQRPLWTGFYLGVHGGGGWGNTRIEDPSFSLTYEPFEFKSSGALAGGQMGANWQFGSFVVGAEVDASWSSVSGDGAPGPDFPLSSFSTKFNALATGTVRVGYAEGAWLGYAKAGVAWADMEFVYNANTEFARSVDHQRTGITGGAGIEVALWGNLSAKVEYNALYFGSTAMSIGARGGETSNVEHLLHVVKAGLNLRFGDDLVSARY